MTFGAHFMWTTQFIGRRLWLWAVYIAVVIAVVSVHYRGEVFETNCDTLPWRAKLWHQRLCLAGHRKPRAHYVRVVTLTEGRDFPPGASCGVRRKFAGSLLLRLRDLGPSMIVMDKYYKPSDCRDSEATDALQDSINQVSRTVPVILGQSSDKYGELRSNNDPDLDRWHNLNLGQGDDVEVLSESSIAADGSGSQLGLVRMACNNWEIPLRWELYPTLRSMDASHKNKIERDALAFVAAKKSDIDLAQAILPHVEHHDSLVGAFLPLRKFHPLTATQVRCGLQATQYDRGECKSGPSEDFSLRGKIVMVGEYRKNDTHQSVIGPIPGFLLQANYIESLLDDRYYQQIPKLLDIVLAILCLVVVDVTIEYARRPLIGAVWSMAAVIALWAVSHFAIMEWGYYFTFWFPMAIAVPVKWLEASIKFPRKTATAHAAG
jgi:hypothetical protein